MENGWPVSYACCKPVSHPKSSYCPDHEAKFFYEPKLHGNKFVRSLRKHTS